MAHSGTALLDPQMIFDAVGLADSMRVADFGCGRTGHFIFLASREVGEKGVVYAVDILRDVLESIASRARSEGYHNIQTIWTDMEKPGAAPIPDGTLDIGFFVNCLFMIKDRPAALAEAARLLAAGAFLVVVDWTRKLGPLGPEPERMLDPETLKKEAEKAGLALARELSGGEHHFCLIFKKTGGI